MEEMTAKGDIKRTFTCNKTTESSIPCMIGIQVACALTNIHVYANVPLNRDGKTSSEHRVTTCVVGSIDRSIEPETPTTRAGRDESQH